MKKTLALLMAACMLTLLLAGCQVNREKDMGQVVLSVGDTVYTKQQVYERMSAELQAGGYAIDIFDEALDAEIRSALDDMAVDYLKYLYDLEVANLVVDRDMPLTEEETAGADAAVNQYVEFVKTYLIDSDAGSEDPAAKTDRDVDELVDEYFINSTGMTVEEYRSMSYKNAKMEKLHNSLIQDVKAEEAAVKNRYEKDLKEQKEAAKTGENYYEELTAADGSMMGSYVLYKPEGYRMVKHILFAYTDGESKELEDMNKKLSDAEKILTDAESAKSAAEKAKAAAETDGKADEAAAQQKIIEQQAAVIVTQTPKVEALRQQYFNLRSRLAAGHLKQAQTVAERLKKGEDFDALLKEFGGDEGMKSGATAILGYLLSPTGYGYDETFVDASEKLTAAGELSEPVVTDFGVHLIKLIYGTEEAELPFDTVKDLVQAYADEEAQETAYEQGLKRYADELGAKYYPDRIKFVK